MDEPQTLRTLGPSPTLRVPTFSVPAREAEADLAGELQRARRELDAGQQMEAPVLRVFENGEVPLSLDYASYEDGLIEDAKANIADSKIELALAQLNEVLGSAPGHHEARYLRAYCLMSRDQEMAALTELESLRADRPEPELAGQVLELRAALRGRLTDRLLAERDEDALAEYLRLVPEEGICWLELAAQRVQRRDLQGAVAAAQAGARAADAEADRRALGRLAHQLRLHLLRALVSRIPELLHQGAYDAALEELRRLGPDWNGFGPLDDLVAYILQISREGPGRPELPADRADLVYDLLAGNDLAGARALLEEGRPEAGLAIMQRTIRLVPTDPFTNFLLGVCLLVTDGDHDEIEEAALIAGTDERIVMATALLGAIALRRVDQKAASIHDFIGNINNCPTARIEQALRRTRALRSGAKGLLPTIGEPFQDQLRARMRVFNENAVQLDLALVSRRLTRLLRAGRHPGWRAEIDVVIRRCGALRRATSEADTRQMISRIEQAARTAREQV